MVLQPKSNLGGYPLILGRPWLATIDAFIGCRFGDMTISQGSSTKKLTLYPPTKPSPTHETPIWIGNEDSDDDKIQQVFMIESTLSFKEKIEDDLIYDLITNIDSPTNHIMHMIEETQPFSMIQKEFQSIPTYLYTTSEIHSMPVEILPGKTLNINPQLEGPQKKKLIELLHCMLRNLLGIIQI
jgi:hypothetical protein